MADLSERTERSVRFFVRSFFLLSFFFLFHLTKKTNEWNINFGNPRVFAVMPWVALLIFATSRSYGTGKGCTTSHEAPLKTGSSGLRAEREGNRVCRDAQFTSFPPICLLKLFSRWWKLCSRTGWERNKSSLRPNTVPENSCYIFRVLCPSYRRENLS